MQNLEGNIECHALVNDTVDCLMAMVRTDPDCHIGVILGNGTNACYRERTHKVLRRQLSDSGGSQGEVGNHGNLCKTLLLWQCAVSMTTLHVTYVAMVTRSS